MGIVSRADPPMGSEERLGWQIGFVALMGLFITLMAVYLARRRTDLIAVRAPFLTTGYTALLLVHLAISYGAWLFIPDLFCAGTAGAVLPVALYLLSRVAAIGAFTAALWRCLQVICRIEAQRMRLAIKLKDQGTILADASLTSRSISDAALRFRAQVSTRLCSRTSCTGIWRH
jgi:hypothetical protein